MKIKFNIKPVLNYVLIILVSAAIISSLLIALPLTEKLSDKVSFNLITKDSSYWSKEYILKLQTTDKKEINKTKEILFKRLRNYGVERVSIVQTESTDNTTSSLRIVVNSSKDESLVGQLISNRFNYEIMTRKSDVDFDDEENPYAYIFSTNYDSTEWNYEDFRNIYITQLRNSEGNYSYFAIFKQWPKQEKDFLQFLKQYEEQYIGVSIDGYVSPFNVQKGTDIFALSLYTSGEEEASVTSILYNSGHIPVEYKLDSENSINPQIISVDYIRVTIGFAISIITAYLYLLIFKHSSKKILLRSFFSTILTLATYLTILKLYNIPVDTFLLTLEAIMISIIIKIVIDNKDSELYILISLLLIFGIVLFLGVGFMTVLAKDMIFLVILSKVCLLISEWYINKVKKI